MSDEIKALQTFCIQIAADVTGVTVGQIIELVEKKVGSLVGRDWTEFLAFLEALAEIIMNLMINCPMADEASLVDAIQHPGFLQRVRVRRVTRDGLNNSSPKARRWRGSVGEVADAILARGAAADEATVAAVLGEIRDYSTAG